MDGCAAAAMPMSIHHLVKLDGPTRRNEESRAGILDDCGRGKPLTRSKIVESIDRSLTLLAARQQDAPRCQGLCRQPRTRTRPGKSRHHSDGGNPEIYDLNRPPRELVAELRRAAWRANGGQAGT